MALRILRLSVAPWLLMSSVVPLSTAPRELSVAELTAAIEIGSRGSAVPYELRWKTSGNPESFTVVGSVYTPLVRVASWVESHAVGRHLYPKDIPKELYADRVVLVAIHKEPPCCPPVIDSPPASVRAALALTRSPGLLITQVDGELPLWSSSDLSQLRRFDSETAARTSALVAIPLERIRAGFTVVVEQQRRDVDGRRLHRFVTNGTIGQEDANSWR